MAKAGTVPNCAEHIGNADNSFIFEIFISSFET